MPPIDPLDDQVANLAHRAGVDERVIDRDHQAAAVPPPRSGAPPRSEVGVIGFSTQTCLPACSASSASVEVRARPAWRSRPRRRRVAQQFAVVRGRVDGGIAGLHAARRRSGRRSLTATTGQPGASAKLRTRFGPQYP